MRIKVAAQRLRLQFRALGRLRFLPLLVFYFLLPLLNVLSLRAYGVSERLYQYILQYAQYFIPLFSCLWPALFLREYLEGDGREVLRASGGNPLCALLLFFLLTLLVLLPLFFFYTLLFSAMAMEYVRFLAECLFFQALLYFFLALTRSLAISLVPLTCYYLWNLFVLSGKQPFFQILDAAPISPELLTAKIVPLSLLGLLLLAAGEGIRHLRDAYT